MSSGVYIRTQKTKDRMSTYLKNNPIKYWLGKKRSKATREKISIDHTGKKLSKETKDKIRDIHIKIGAPWLIGKKQSKKTIKKRIKSLTGQKRTKETKIKMSLWQKNKPHLNQRKNKHWNWKGGVSSINEKINGK